MIARLLHISRILALAYVLVVVIAPPGVAKMSVPPWSQFQGGPTHEASVPDGPEAPYEIVWEFKGGGGASGPIADYDVAYTVGSDAVHAVRLSDGTEEWSVPRSGPVTTPAITGQVLLDPRVLAYTDGEGSETKLVGVNADSHKQLWTAPLEDDSTSGVTDDLGRLLVGNNAGKLFSVNFLTGKVSWSTDLGDGEIDSPPVVAEGLVIAGIQNPSTGVFKLVAVNEEDGSREWSYKPVATGFPSALTVANGKVVASYTDRNVRAINAESGTVSWSSLVRFFGSLAVAPAASGDAVYVTDVSGGLYRLDDQSGTREWDFQFNWKVPSGGGLAQRGSPIVAGDYVVLGLQDGRLVAVDAETGELAWEQETGDGALKSIAVAGDTLVIGKGGDDGGLVAFRHDPDGRLTHIPSPTTLDLGGVLVSFAIGFLIVFALVLGIGLLIKWRLPPEEVVDLVEAEEGE